MGVFSKYKVYINYIITIFVVFFGVSIVFGSNIIFEQKLELRKISNNIFLDVKNLNKNLVVYTSDLDLSKYNLATGCELESKYLGKKKTDYYFVFSYKEDCKNPNIYLKDSKGNYLEKSHIKMNIFSNKKIFEMFADSKLIVLKKIEKKLEKSIGNLAKKVERYKTQKESFEYLKSKILLEENIYKNKILKQVISGKEKKYTIPVVGHILPTEATRVPNAGRGYRKTYTDGVHHGWDIMGYFGEEVVAIDDAVIVRIVDNFSFENLSEIKKGKNISKFEKTKNLDLLRGNQVWLKTTKGDVMFYSHLNEIYSNLKTGDIIKRGQAIGTIGITGVPDKSYTNYHLHFPIMKNPRIRKKTGKYEIDDYLNWDWYFKGKSLDYVLRNQNKVFYN